MNQKILVYGRSSPTFSGPVSLTFLLDKNSRFGDRRLGFTDPRQLKLLLLIHLSNVPSLTRRLIFHLFRLMKTAVVNRHWVSFDKNPVEIIVFIRPSFARRSQDQTSCLD